LFRSKADFRREEVVTLKTLIASMIVLAAFPAASAEYSPPKKRISPGEGLVAQIVPKGETPRRADGHPDLNGRWVPALRDVPHEKVAQRGLDFVESDKAATRRAAAWNKPHYKPEFWDKVHSMDYGKVMDDPGFNCTTHGVPRLNGPQEIIMNDKSMVTVNGASWRKIPIDGSKHLPEDFDYETFLGVPVGQWDGDTLVVESVGFNDVSWFGFHGYFHTNHMTVTERFTRRGDVLYYQFVVNDPEVLVEPWTSDVYARMLNNSVAARLEEVPPCHERDRDRIVDPYFRN
jgi:hypothetical protein